MRKKAMLAMLFVGGMLNSQHLPAYADNENVSSPYVIEAIANQSDILPEQRAYHLLTIAHCLLNGESVGNVDKRFSYVLSDNSFGRSRHNLWKLTVANWVNFAARDFNSKIDKPIGPLSTEGIALAKSALHKAITSLENCTDEFSKLNLYFIASRLFKRVGDTDDMLKCDKIISNTIHSCEKKNSQVNDDRINASALILNSMAEVIIPVRILDYDLPNFPRTVSANGFTESDFKKTEVLKLKSLAITDRLPSTNHERRLAHRNMVLWYTALGKVDKAAAEKEILFNLVGINDDRILYPKGEGCGRVTWWVLPTANGTGFDCGMG